jgi:hypothetical protein
VKESEFVLFENAHWRTARKVWRCAGHVREDGYAKRDAAGRFLRCGHVIQRGERCVEYLGESPYYESGPHYCVPCARTEGLLGPVAVEVGREVPS